MTLPSEILSSQVRQNFSPRHVSSDDVISIMAEQDFPTDSPQCWLQHVNTKRKKV